MYGWYHSESIPKHCKLDMKIILCIYNANNITEKSTERSEGNMNNFKYVVDVGSSNNQPETICMKPQVVRIFAKRYEHYRTIPFNVE